MSGLSIYFSDASELAEYEATSRGYRTDVYIRINNDIFNVNIYSMIRLQQDFESETESYGFYTIEPNLILVKNSNKAEIIKTVNQLYEQKYFEKIHPVKHIQITNLTKIC